MTKVLIIDDSRFDRHMIRRALHTADDGVDITELSSGEQAIETIKAESPCLTVLDIRMPNMDGFEVLTAIRDHEALATHPVVMLSGSDRKVDRTLADQHGADGYYVKPETARGYADLGLTLHSEHIPCSSLHQGEG